MHACGYCYKEFTSEISVSQHAESVHYHKEIDVDCQSCFKTFTKKSSMLQHIRDTGHQRHGSVLNTEKLANERNKVILQHSLQSSMLQYIRDTGHQGNEMSKHQYGSVLNTKKLVDERNKDILQHFLQERLSFVSVDDDDREKSREITDQILQVIAKCFDCCGGIFSTKFRKSGSSSTRTKVIEADEYDYDIPLVCNLEDLHLRTQGKVNYGFSQNEKNSSLNKKMKVIHKHYGKSIPDGYGTIKTSTGEQYIPRKVQEELYKELECATCKYSTISIHHCSHGPAVTLKYEPADYHSITIDFSVSIYTNQVTLTDFDWPRVETKNVLSNSLLKNIINAGIHLIPKCDTFWYLSVSLAEKVLLNEIDQPDNGCRRDCHKLLKADFRNWNAINNYEFNEITTIVFKHQLFWMNEEDCKRNWSKENFHNCYPEMLVDLSKRLRSGNLPNYFKISENILKGKDKNVLTRIANLAHKRIWNLINLEDVPDPTDDPLSSCIQM